LIEWVLDASIIAKWFNRAGEAHVSSALRLRASFERGALLIVVPPLLHLEIVNAASRRWGWGAEALVALAENLLGLALEVQQPSLPGIARWAGRGLTAYDACYVALAEERRTVVITADQRILAVAGGLARPLDAEEEPT
jgi:predicted nucleic acid-binding protein